MSEAGGLLSRWNKRYALEYALGVGVYLLILWLCLPAAMRATTLPDRALLLIAPCAAIVLLAIIVIRHLLRLDEFLRLNFLEHFAVAGAFTGVWTLAYGFFEAVGFPRISVWWIWPGIGLSMLLWWLFKWARAHRV